MYSNCRKHHAYSIYAILPTGFPSPQTKMLRGLVGPYPCASYFNRQLTVPQTQSPLLPGYRDTQFPQTPLQMDVATERNSRPVNESGSPERHFRLSCFRGRLRLPGLCPLCLTGKVHGMVSALIMQEKNPPRQRCTQPQNMCSPEDIRHLGLFTRGGVRRSSRRGSVVNESD